MDPVPYTRLSKGTFLIASPEIDNGLYFRSVILICEHTPSGSFGLIINKPLDADLPEDLIDLKNASNSAIQSRTGGPIAPNQMMLLHSSPTLGEQALKVTEGVFLGGDMQFLQESLNNASGPALRLCFGYTGWNPGQLEREFMSGNWFLTPATARHIFETHSDKLWQTLLREMGGKYATLSMIPEDLSLN
jgi:putative transcriptional regulator